ncbi:MAG: TIGR00289 family protein [Candidatus Woesearchaeota archaeon]|jgi:diphthine-ammonia ligase|nr:TIGR00289 family protein [Candidatus Woesearchaeota archaeon]
MKVAVLFSGGKDSNYALYKANQKNEVVCLITLVSENKESYMFQTQGIDFVKVQSQALGIPIIEYKTKGEKEKELEDLQLAIELAKEQYNIEGVVTGAINSAYQSSRIQTICQKLNIWCFNPLWQKNQVDFLYELLENNFKIIIVGIFSYPFDKSYLGRILDKNLIKELTKLEKKYKINPAGEGGELETFVIDSPLFKKEIKLLDVEKHMDSENAGILEIKEVKLVDK